MRRPDGDYEFVKHINQKQIEEEKPKEIVEENESFKEKEDYELVKPEENEELMSENLLLVLCLIGGVIIALTAAIIILLVNKSKKIKLKEK